MARHGSAMCTLLPVHTTHTHTYIHTHTHTSLRGDCWLRQHTLHWVPYTHTTTALSLIFSCMAASPTKHFTLPLQKLHITFHTKKPKPTLESRIYVENCSRKHPHVWLRGDVTCTSYRSKSKSDIHLARILLVAAQWLFFFLMSRGKRNKSYFSERGLNSIK